MSAICVRFRRVYEGNLPRPRQLLTAGNGSHWSCRRRGRIIRKRRRNQTAIRGRYEEIADQTQHGKQIHQHIPAESALHPIIVAAGRAIRQRIMAQICFTAFGTRKELGPFSNQPHDLSRRGHPGLFSRVRVVGASTSRSSVAAPPSTRLKKRLAASTKAAPSAVVTSDFSVTMVL
jgi:hypothetical protein